MQRPAITATALLLSLAGCSAEPLWWQDQPGAQLSSYKQTFAAAVGDRCTAAWAYGEFAAALRQCRVLWLGDDHRDRELHRLQSELLQRLADDGVQPLLLLEAIGEQDQAAVDRYLQYRLDMPQLRQQCRQRWPQSWLDDGDVDAAAYRGLLQLARDRRWPVRALEPTPRLPLPQRDQCIAAAVADAAARFPQRLLVVLVGQAHLLGDGDVVARAALPSLVLAATPPAGLQPAPALPAAAMFVRTDRGVLFFAARAPGAAYDVGARASAPSASSAAMR